MVELHFESTKADHLLYFCTLLLASVYLRSMHILPGQSKNLLGVHPLAGHKCERTLFIYIRA